MARKPDTPCSVCGTLLWTGTGSLPAEQRRCRPCRAAARYQQRRHHRELETELPRRNDATSDTEGGHPVSRERPASVRSAESPFSYSGDFQESAEGETETGRVSEFSHTFALP